jgi:predicted hotdog family 3-hydroxylacyl-ACP dehydratase
MNLLSETITDKVFVENLIPQKKPFIMVDKLIFFSEEKVVSGLKVTEENIFSKNNIFSAPGVMEHMAQTVALHTGYEYFLKNLPAPTGYIGAIKKVEIFQLPRLSDELITTVKILHEFMGVTLVQIDTVCDGIVIAKSEMKTVIVN